MEYVGEYIYIKNHVLSKAIHCNFKSEYSLFRISCRSNLPYYQIISLTIKNNIAPFHSGDFHFKICPDRCLYVTKATILYMVTCGYIIKNNTKILDKMLEINIGSINFDHMLSWENKYAPLA